MDRTERERRFHNQQVEKEFRSRKLLGRLTRVFSDQGEKGILWAPLWREMDLLGKTVLDYGCGDGGFSNELARRHAIVHGIDISEKMIILAKQSIRTATGRVEFSVQDAHRTGFPDNFFDMVFGNAILHHLDIEKAWSEVARILKPGGKAFFMEPLDKHPLLRLIRSITPSARSADERPLSLEDIVKARQPFRIVSHNEYFLLAVAVAPLHLIGRASARLMLRMLHRLDQRIFQVIPGSRRFAWITRIELEKA